MRGIFVSHWTAQGQEILFHPPHFAPPHPGKIKLFLYSLLYIAHKTILRPYPPHDTTFSSELQTLKENYLEAG